MLKWKIGDVTVTRIVEIEGGAFPAGGGAGTMLPDASPENVKTVPWLVPHFADEKGWIKASVHALLVDAPGVRLVVDTCVGNDKARGNPFFNQLKTPFLDHLKAAGWSRESVNAVVCTHLHVDHVGWNTMLEGERWVPTFPKARYLIGRAEYDHWSKEGDGESSAILSDSVKPIFDAGLADLVAMDHVISPELRLVPTPGHTPGHVSVSIQSKGERAMITGDLMHHPIQIAHPEWSSGFDSDQGASRRTRKEFLETVADNGTLVIGTHFAAPTAGHVKRDGQGYRLIVS